MQAKAREPAGRRAALAATLPLGHASASRALVPRSYACRGWMDTLFYCLVSCTPGSMPGIENYECKERTEENRNKIERQNGKQEKGKSGRTVHGKRGNCRMPPQGRPQNRPRLTQALNRLSRSLRCTSTPKQTTAHFRLCSRGKGGGKPHHACQRIVSLAFGGQPSPPPPPKRSMFLFVPVLCSVSSTAHPRRPLRRPDDQSAREVL